MSCTLLAVACLLGPAAPAPGPPVTPPAATAPASYFPSRVTPDLFGTDASNLKGTNLAVSRQAQLAGAASDGLRVVRRVAAWNEIEPNGPDFLGRHTYYWGEYDNFARDVAAAGLRWQPFFWTPPCWATSESTLTCDHNANRSSYGPANRSDFNALVMAFAQRYGRGGSFWAANPSVPYVPVTSYEIWNEENERSSWGPEPNTYQYGNLLTEARQWLLSADPQATVVVGGMAREDTMTTDWMGVKSYQDTAFLAGVYQAAPSLRNAGSAVAIGYHPYAVQTTAQAAVTDIQARIANLRHTINDPATVNDPAAQIYITEVGWATQGTTPHNVPVLPDVAGTGGRPYALSTMANTLARSNCGVGQMLVETWVTAETAGSADKLDWMGIYAPDATPHPAGTAYANEVKTLQGQNPSVNPNTDPGYAPTLSIC